MQLGFWQNAGAYGVLLVETDLTPNYHRTLQHAAARSDRQDARCGMPRLGGLPGCSRSPFAGRLPCCRQLSPAYQSSRRDGSAACIPPSPRECHRNRHHNRRQKSKVDHAIIVCGSPLTVDSRSLVCMALSQHQCSASIVLVTHAAFIAFLPF